MNFIKRLFCKHEFEFSEHRDDGYYLVMWSVYKCKKCNKKIEKEIS